MQPARHPRLRRAVTYTALATLLGVVAITLSQCTQVGDTLTGVGLTANRHGVSCKKLCDDFYILGMKQENQIHQANMQACGNDPACKAAENARRAAAIDALQSRRDACRANCHRQGGGTAG